MSVNQESVTQTASVELKSLRNGGTELTGRSVYFTTRSQNFDLNQYTVRKGTQDWGGLQGNIDRLDQHRQNLERNEEGLVPVDVQKIEKRAKDADSTKFGTWDGVFVACLLNIFGVIMFLRLPWAVGQAGVVLCIAIVLLSNVVTGITTMSMSAIATNGEVRAGGAYYLISRALGHRMGGPIGILFSFGQAVATALYVIGFCETMVLLLGEGNSITGDQMGDIRVYGLVVITVILLLALIGLDWVVKLQIFLLVLMWASIFCVIIGSFTTTNEEKGVVGWGSGALEDNVGPEYRDGYDFFSVFGVFFPAVTGIMAGANKSGDLINPSENIPKGTIWAIWVSMITYIVLTIFLGAVCERHPEGSGTGLYEDPLIMVEVAVPYIGAPLVLAGIFAATFSSGLASIVGAPRILMAVAQDNLIPLIKPFAVVRARDQEPVRGYYLTYVISVACILVGDLNAIAPLISMFFMITYGLVNLACFMLAFSKSPSWRPTFKYYNKWVSLFGFFLCLVVMFLTNWYIALTAIVVAASLYYYIDFRDPPVNWGSANQARQFYDVERSMMRMRHFQTHVKTFRPHYLVMTGEPKDRLDLCRFIATLRKGYGITIFGNVCTGDYLDQAKEFRRRNYQNGYFNDDSIAGVKVTGFFATTIASSIRNGCRNLLCCSGLGIMRPNTLVVGFKSDWKERWASEQKAAAEAAKVEHKQRLASAEGSQRKSKSRSALEGLFNVYNDSARGGSGAGSSTVEDYVGMIYDGFKIGLGVMVARNLDKINWTQGPQPNSTKTVDVWWLVDDGGLCALIPYILSLNPWWQQRTGISNKLTHVRLMLVAEKEDAKQIATITSMLKMFRIPWLDDIKQCTLGETTGEMLENYKTYSKRDKVKKEAQEKNEHWLKVASIIKQESKDAALVFITLPYPVPGIDPSLYMSWLDSLSEDRPTVMLRGNNENVLTFYLE